MERMGAWNYIFRFSGVLKGGNSDNTLSRYDDGQVDGLYVDVSWLDC